MDVMEAPHFFEGCAHVFHDPCVVVWRADNEGCEGGCPTCLDLMVGGDAQQDSPASVPPWQESGSEQTLAPPSRMTTVGAGEVTPDSAGVAAAGLGGPRQAELAGGGGTSDTV